MPAYTARKRLKMFAFFLFRNNFPRGFMSLRVPTMSVFPPVRQDRVIAQLPQVKSTRKTVNNCCFKNIFEGLPYVSLTSCSNNSGFQKRSSFSHYGRLQQ